MAEVGRGHAFWVVRISRVRHCGKGTRTHGGAWFLSDEIDAQSGDDGSGVVFVQGQAVVEQGGRLVSTSRASSRSTSGRARATAPAVSRN